jgi:hypothetical protein
MMRMGQPGELLPGFLQDMLRLSDPQKRQLADLQKQTDSKLEKILNEEQRAQLKRIKESGPGGFGGPGGRAGGPGGPPDGRQGGGLGGGPGGGPGGMGGGMGIRVNGVELDPLVALDDPRKPLRGKVLAVPSLRTRYLRNVKTIAEKSLDWKNLGPVVAQYRALIEKEVQADTRKLESYTDFLRFTADSAESATSQGRGPMILRSFADQRRKYLLDHPEIKKLSASASAEAKRGGGR